MSKKDVKPPPDRGETPRTAIRAALQGPALTAREISVRTSMREKDVAEHLEHLERSLKREGERLVIEPAKCLACDFVFKSRGRLTTPGSCPECRSERIAPPAFRIESKSKS
ncbi:MAG: transcriptional regulator [Minicystis sp.]